MNYFLCLVCFIQIALAGIYGDFTSDEINAANQAIYAAQPAITNLNGTFTHSGKNFPLSLFDGYIQSKMPEALAGMSAPDKKSFLLDYMIHHDYYMYSDADFPVICARKNEGLAAQVPPGTPRDCAGDASFRLIVVDNVEKVLESLFPGENKFAEVFSCEKPDQFDLINGLLNRVTNDPALCLPLEPGQERVYTHIRPYAPGYLLRRKPDGNYQAVLNMNFIPTDKATVTPQDMMRRAQECAAAIAPYMKGPAPGNELLEIVPMSSAEIQNLPAASRPPVNNINIVEDGRANAVNYGNNDNCSTMAHEMLHLLGLCDEYQETDSKMLPDFDCRVVTTTPSIMSSHTDAFFRYVPSAIECGCAEGSTCATVMASADENIRKIYTQARGLDAIPASFRASFCRDRAVSADAPMIEPDKAIVVTNDLGTNLSFETRSVERTSTAPFYRLTRRQVSCTCSSSSCQTQKAQILEQISSPRPARECPDGTPTRIASNPIAQPTTLRDGVLSIRGSQNETGSLLRPNHFNQIMAGPCTGGPADNYKRCSSYGSHGSRSAVNCNPPPECRDDNFFLGSSQ